MLGRRRDEGVVESSAAVSGDGRYDGIIEVVEARWPRINEFLEHGYKLMGLFGSTWQKNGPAGWYVWRGVTYVLSRPADVAHYDPPWPPAVVNDSQEAN